MDIFFFIWTYFFYIRLAPLCTRAVRSSRGFSHFATFPYRFKDYTFSEGEFVIFQTSKYHKMHQIAMQSRRIVEWTIRKLNNVGFSVAFVRFDPIYRERAEIEGRARKTWQFWGYVVQNTGCYPNRRSRKFSSIKRWLNSDNTSESMQRIHINTTPIYHWSIDIGVRFVQFACTI